MPSSLAIIGYCLLGLGAVITCFNFYLSWLRPLLHRATGGTRGEFRWVSGIPLIGSAFLWISIPMMSTYPWLMWTAGVLSLFDTGGIHWFAVTMLWMRVFKKHTTTRVERDFSSRPDWERGWMMENTWCGSCKQADLGMTHPAEFEEGNRVFVEGRCRRCGRRVVSEVITQER